METFDALVYGLKIGLEPNNLFFCFLGVLIGTLIGVLPGIGPAAAIALLLPATYKLSPTPALIMLAGIYYGAMFRAFQGFGLIYVELTSWRPSSNLRRFP